MNQVLMFAQVKEEVPGINTFACSIYSASLLMMLQIFICSCCAPSVHGPQLTDDCGIGAGSNYGSGNTSGYGDNRSGNNSTAGMTTGAAP